MIYKKKLKWNHKTPVRPGIIKRLEENIAKFLDIGVGNEFLDMIPKSQATKAKIDKEDCIKLKSFCTAKNTIIKVKGNLQNGRKYLQIAYLVRG